jgi:hypothetical protein
MRLVCVPRRIRRAGRTSREDSSSRLNREGSTAVVEEYGGVSQGASGEQWLEDGGAGAPCEATSNVCIVGCGSGERKRACFSEGRVNASTVRGKNDAAPSQNE